MNAADRKALVDKILNRVVQAAAVGSENDTDELHEIRLLVESAGSPVDAGAVISFVLLHVYDLYSGDFAIKLNRAITNALT